MDIKKITANYPGFYEISSGKATACPDVVKKMKKEMKEKISNNKNRFNQLSSRFPIHLARGPKKPKAPEEALKIVKKAERNGEANYNAFKIVNTMNNGR